MSMTPLSHPAQGSTNWFTPVDTNWTTIETAINQLLARTLNTTAPLTGGGDLSADRTLAISNFTGDSGSGGAKGAVPAPAAGDAAAKKYLFSDGTWRTILTSDLSGTLAIGSGGTNSSTALANGSVMGSAGGKIQETTAIAASGNDDLSGIDIIANGGAGTGAGVPGLLQLKYPCIHATDSTAQSLSAAHPINSTLFVQTTGVTVAADAGGDPEKTLIGTVVGTITVDAGSMRVGRVIRISAHGVITTTNPTSPTLQLRIKWGGSGGTLIADTGAQASVVNQTGNLWEVVCNLTFRTISATSNSSSVEADGLWKNHASSGAGGLSNIKLLNFGGNVLTTIDTTANKDIFFSAQWGTATSGNTIVCTQLIAEILN